MNFPWCFLLRWERRRWRTLGSCWRLIMPNLPLMTLGSSEFHIEVPFFYLPVSVGMGVPDCKAMWINDLNVRLWNKSLIPTALRHPQEMNTQASVRAGCDRLCRAEICSWTVRLARWRWKTNGVRLSPPLTFSAMCCEKHQQVWRGNTTMIYDLSRFVCCFHANLCMTSWIVSCILGSFAHFCPCHIFLSMIQSTKVHLLQNTSTCTCSVSILCILFGPFNNMMYCVMYTLYLLNISIDLNSIPKS